MPSEVSRELTLELAMRGRRTHAPADGWCQHCLVAWPCEAAERIEQTIQALGPPGVTPGRAVGIAQVHPGPIR
jgi:hypothetical protein